jgi:hypothetical protein
MNLAQALKLKNRYIQQISQFQQDIQGNNSVPSENSRKIEINQTIEELERTVHNLIKLKLLIFEASASMRETILTLSELKSRIVFLKGIDTHEGKGKKDEYIYTMNEEIKYEVMLDVIWVRSQIQKCEEEIDKLQNELDTFNYQTEIEIH